MKAFRSLKHSLVPFTLLFVCIFLLQIIIPVCAVSSGPRLIISNLSGEELAYPGYPYHATVTLENRGDQTSGITTVVMFLKSPEYNDNATVCSITVDSVRSGDTSTIEGVGTISADLPPGLYQLYGYLPEVKNRGTDETGTLARLPSLITVEKRPLPDSETMRQDIIIHIRDQTNVNRIREGLNPLEWDTLLAEIADTYARNISGSRFLSHTDSNGNGPAERANEFGYRATKEIEGGIRIGVSENLAYIGTGMVTGVGYVDPTSSSAIADAFMKGWMNSPGHRKNILDPLADRFGVGLFWNGEYYYAVSEFW